MANSNIFRFWERLTLRRHSSNNNNNNENENNNIIECGIIRPPEFYEGDDLLDKENSIASQEREPILSRIVWFSIQSLGRLFLNQMNHFEVIANELKKTIDNNE